MIYLSKIDKSQLQPKCGLNEIQVEGQPLSYDSPQQNIKTGRESF